MSSLPQIPPTGKPLSQSQKDLIRMLAEVAARDFLEHDALPQAVPDNEEVLR